MPNLDPGSPGSNKIFSIRGPRSPGSHGYIAVTGSMISKIPRENEDITSKIFQDLGFWILGIQDPGYFWDIGWHMSAWNEPYENDASLWVLGDFFILAPLNNDG